MTHHILQNRSVMRIFALLNRGGEEVRVVGGAVRDALLGYPSIQEIDFATTALPQEVMARAKAAGLPMIPTGLAHGTLTLLSEGEAFEVTTLREDVETDGRHARVRFGRDFEKDARRRDFTFNALYLRQDGTIDDSVGGLADLRARRVRFIGEARLRIREDYLRILRFFRFYATYAEGPCDPQVQRAILQEKNGLIGLSRERIGTEILKLLLTPRLRETSLLMQEMGIWEVLMGPNGSPMIERLEHLLYLEKKCALRACVLTRLYALFGRDLASLSPLKNSLRLSNAQLETLVLYARGLSSLPAPLDIRPLRDMLRHYGREHTIEILSLSMRDVEEIQQGIAWAREAPIPHMPITGADLIARGYAPGQEIGAILRRFTHVWQDAHFPEGEAEIEALLDQVLHKGK